MSPGLLDAVAERERARRAGASFRVAVCDCAGCRPQGSKSLREALRRAVEDAGLSGRVYLHGTGCLGPCSAGPMVQVEAVSPPARTLYREVDAAAAARIVREHLGEGRPVPGGRIDADDPFLARQERIVLAGSGRVDPEDIDSCIADGAYRALQRALTAMTPAQVVEEVVRSGLRGRGGAGYPTGLKWATVGKSGGARKFVVCNADEGDPGAFMDRSVLEGDPHRVLEGMAIAAYAVGAGQGYVYVRGEYPLAIERLRIAIAQAERLHVLGSRVLDTAFQFRIDLRIGAGAYVCGEETALLQSIEGRRGQPRPRPPYPAQSGLWGAPTLINNVETLANVPAIVTRGGAWFARLGTERSKGTKVFALTGRVVRSGVVEVPMGITLREIVYDLGGGIPGGRAFKAAQTGGPGGGCIPAQHLDLPVDYESLQAVGTMMGSGGLVVLDETTCMVDLARFFVSFCRQESCGKCVPCRAGTVQLEALLRRITEGRGCEADLSALEELADLMRQASLCGLGQSAPNPLLSTLRWFREEYLAHVRDRRCPAGVCAMARSGAEASA